LLQGCFAMALRHSADLQEVSRVIKSGLQQKSSPMDRDTWLTICRAASVPEAASQMILEKFGSRADGKIDYAAVLDFLAGNSQPRILLVSDNLPFFEQIIKATKDCVCIVPVQYKSWSLEDLKKAIEMRAGEPAKQFASVGLLDHGAPGEFCLLDSVGGGSIDLGDFQDANGQDIIAFFKWLAGYVRAPSDLHKWQEDLSARIDLLACSVAAGSGMKLLAHLENVTQVNWAASIDKTGAGPEVEDGFDWDLETEKDLGSVAPCYFHVEEIAKWQHAARGFWQGVGMIAGGAVFAAGCVATGGGLAAVAAGATAAAGMGGAIGRGFD